MPATLKLGSKGPDVTRLQNLLNQKSIPSPNLVPDGDFGNKTDKAVRAFQKAKGLTPDGIVGPKTWGALDGPPVKVGGSGGSGSNNGSNNGNGSNNNGDTSDTPWITIARKERDAGVAEYAGTNANNPRILEYISTFGYLSGIEYGNSGKKMSEVDETAWCACFVNWCLTKAGKGKGPSARAKDWLNYGTALSEPKFGAICVVYHQPNSGNASTTSSGNHVAFYTGGNNSNLTLLGGNQGNKVSEKNYGAYWTVQGYRWPK